MSDSDNLLLRSSYVNGKLGDNLPDFFQTSCLKAARLVSVVQLI